MKLGQFVVRVPLTIQMWVDKPRLHLESRPMRGRVVYIHPRRHFHVVEFDSPCGPIRESFLGVSV